MPKEYDVSPITDFAMRRASQTSPFIVATTLFCLMTPCLPAHADDSPFVDQIPGRLTINAPTSSERPLNLSNVASSVSNFATPPQFVLAHRTNSNFSATVETGSRNNVFQFQNGVADDSTVGIIGGNSNNVFVAQGGSNLQSNLLMIGTKGVNAFVLQPNGSAPVNAAIIHVPAGTIIIPR
jgi:hypothetical protein